MLEPNQQFKELLTKSKEILILAPENPDGDQLGSALALFYFLEKNGANPSIAFSSEVSEKYSFLPVPEKLMKEIASARDFVLSFDTTRNKIKNVRYEETDKQFNIFITPEKGSVDPRDFSFIPEKYNFDLVVILGSPDLGKLGKIYEDNGDLFFEIPVVNIDFKSENENFGKVNLVNLNASSVAEILYYIFQEINPEFIDEKIAQCLLTGIISATDSFQKKNTTPKSMLTSALLMDKGANQQEIVRWMYKTQTLSILKLWGRVMSKINWEENLKMVWSELTVEDFVQSRSKIEDLPIILEKLQTNFNEGQIFSAIYNDTMASSVAVIRASSEETLKKILPLLGGTYKNGILEIKLETNDLTEAGKILKEKLS